MRFLTISSAQHQQLHDDPRGRCSLETRESVNAFLRCRSDTAVQNSILGSVSSKIAWNVLCSVLVSRAPAVILLVAREVP